MSIIQSWRKEEQLYSITKYFDKLVQIKIYISFLFPFSWTFSCSLKTVVICNKWMKVSLYNFIWSIFCTSHLKFLNVHFIFNKLTLDYTWKEAISEFFKTIYILFLIQNSTSFKKNEVSTKKVILFILLLQFLCSFIVVFMYACQSRV